MKIGIDIDDVLFEFITNLMVFYNGKHGTNFKKEDVFSFNLGKVWKKERKEVNEEVLDFFKSNSFSELRPIIGSQESISLLSKKNKLAIVTSRPEITKEQTSSWLEKFYPGSFSKIHFTNHFLEIGQKKSKADICLENGYDVLIEDNKDYALECAEKGIKVFLFNRPWNKDFTTHENITPVDSWEEIIIKLK
jgi:hypothetical protein|tara:strand:- start:1 stop:576 length:576 start_codon:yes stop_codon:yes gene_type:complete